MSVPTLSKLETPLDEQGVAADQVASEHPFDDGTPTPDAGSSPLAAPGPLQMPDTGGSTLLDEQLAAKQKQAAAKQDQLLGGTTVTSTTSSRGSAIVATAEKYLGTPYVWGGSGAGGVDCSGLVQLAYRAVGIDLPRISYQQAGAGQRVGLGALRPGDLVAWDNSPRNPGADHIAIYIGNGKIIEAAHPGTNVRIRSLGKNEGAWGVRMGW